MNRKEQRKLRKLRGAVARENYQRNKREWSSRFGPRVVMEEPTEAHVKDLLMKWVAVNNLRDKIQEETKFHPVRPSYTQIMKMLLGRESLLDLFPPPSVRELMGILEA
jgi:hypothetical protein